MLKFINLICWQFAFFRHTFAYVISESLHKKMEGVMWYLIRVIVIVLFLFSFSTIEAQSKGKVKARGIVYHKNRPIDGAIIDVYADGIKQEIIITKANGKFKVIMDLNKKYIVNVSQFGKCTKKVSVDTNIPDSESGIWQIAFEISLFDLMTGLDVSALDEPVAKITYDETNGYFDFDARYSAIMAQKVELIKKQLDLLSK